MDTDQIVFWGSAACVGLAFLVMLIAMFLESGRGKRALADERAKRSALEKRFSVIVDADAEAKRIVDTAISQASEREANSRNLVVSLERQIATLSSNLEEVRGSYVAKKAIFDRLAKEVAIFDERLAFAEMGVYEPHFDFDTSEEFKEAINRVRDRQKAMVSNKTAVIGRIHWTVDGSASKGKTMTERSVRLTLRAFSSECDAAIANTRWNNANAMEKRIENARNQIDKHNDSYQVEITSAYFQLKLEELWLTHEFREKVKQERRKGRGRQGGEGRAKAYP